jgi:hypothetical protein
MKIMETLIKAHEKPRKVNQALMTKRLNLSVTTVFKSLRGPADHSNYPLPRQVIKLDCDIVTGETVADAKA